MFLVHQPVSKFLDIKVNTVTAVRGHFKVEEVRASLAVPDYDCQGLGAQLTVVSRHLTGLYQVLREVRHRLLTWKREVCP